MAQKIELIEALSFANENPSCHIATSVDGKPQIRGLLMWFADETGFYFHTSSTKKLAAQIKKNPYVAGAFLKPTQDPAQVAELRVTGKVEIIEDEELEKRLYQERPWLLEYEKFAPGAKLVLFRIVEGEAYLWEMSDNLREQTIEVVAF